MKKSLIGGLFATAVLALGLTTQAAQLTNDQISAILNLLKSFNADSATVLNVQSALTGTVASSTPVGLGNGNAGGIIMLAHMLRQGMSGDEVKLLQTLLASDTDVYPEGLITGTFGPLTTKAVAKFQKKHGLDQVGFVGPRTLEQLNKDLENNPLDREDGDNDGKKERLCAKVPPGHLIAPGWLRKHDGERPIVPPCQIVPPGIENHRDDDDDNEHGTTTHHTVFDFSLSNNGSKTVTRGENATSTITATLTAGTSTRPVAFSVSGLPTGITGWFTQAACSPTCTSFLVLHASSTAAVGTSTISVTASTTPLLRLTSFALGVKATSTATTTAQ